MVFLGCICLSAHCQPYKERQNSVLASVGQTQIYFALFGALIISNGLLGGGWDVAVGALLVVLNTAVLVMSQGREDGYRAVLLGLSWQALVRSIIRLHHVPFSGGGKGCREGREGQLGRIDGYPWRLLPPRLRYY